MDVTCFKCGKTIHATRATRATRALTLHLRACHTTTGPNEQLVCSQNGCQRTCNLMSSLLNHIRHEHLNNQNLQQEHHGVEEHPLNSNDLMETDSNNSSDDDGVDEDKYDYMETFSVATLKKLAFSMTMRLKSSSAVPFSAIQNVMHASKVMFQDTLGALKHSMLQVFQTHGVNTTSAEVQELCTKFSSFENPFLGIETPRQQINYMVDNLMLVPPLEIALGITIDQVVDRATCGIVPKAVTETFQYIPILDVLKLVLKPHVQNLFQNEKLCPPGFMRGYRDGQQYQQHSIFKTHPQALRLQLFYDDVEVTNPIGSNAGIQKLGLFYYTIQNLPFSINTSMNSVFLLAVCYTTDIKKYGFQPILDPFVKEVKQLESDSGVVLQWDGRVSEVHGTFHLVLIPLPHTNC